MLAETWSRARRAKHGSQGKPPVQGCFLRLKSRCGPPPGQTSAEHSITGRTDGESHGFFLPLREPPFSSPDSVPHLQSYGWPGIRHHSLSLQGVDKLGPGSLGGKWRHSCCGNKAAKEAFFISQENASAACFTEVPCVCCRVCAGADDCKL